MGGHNRSSSTAEAIDKSVSYPPATHTTKKYPTVCVKDKLKYTNEEVKPSEARSLKDKYATLLGISKKQLDNVALYSFIEDWLGVEYHLGGLDKSGIDCSGFAKRLYEAVFGMELSHSSGEQYSSTRHLKKGSEPSEGDLVFFRTHGRRISHVGVYLWNDYFVHASTSQGVTVSSLKEEYWHKHYVGAGKMF
jgi:lipoprotein Spr